MTTLLSVLITLVALEFLYIFYLETLATTSKKTQATFGLTKAELSDKSINTLLKNQGVYNGLIGLLLLLNHFVLRSQLGVQFILGLIILVAAYGAVTSNPKILIKQGGIAIITFILLLFVG